MCVFFGCFEFWRVRSIHGSWPATALCFSGSSAACCGCEEKKCIIGAAPGCSRQFESLFEQQQLQGIDPQVVCFGEMLIDFVPATNGLSLAEAPAFMKAPGGAPAMLLLLGM